LFLNKFLDIWRIIWWKYFTFYILNVSFLILHEIESGYEKEREILKLPGKITGFLLLHIPILFMIFYGFYCIVTFPQTRGLVSIIVGITGFIPFLVHKVFVNKKEYFNKIISNIIMGAAKNRGK
jgi:hypothetical protein